MANPAAAIRAAHPGKNVKARHRSELVLAGEGVNVHVSTAGQIHFGPNFDQEIDSDLVAGGALGGWRMVNAPYNALIAQSFDAAPLVRYADPDSGEGVQFTPGPLFWGNSNGDTIPVSDPLPVVGSVSGDVASWQHAYGQGIHFQWRTDPVRLQKRLVIPNRTALTRPPLAFRQLDAYLALRLRFEVPASVVVRIGGQDWDEATERETGSRVEFYRRSDRKFLWAFTPAFALDGDETEQPLLARYKQMPGGVGVEIRVPYNWLWAAPYPVQIDPTVTVAAGADDAYEADDGSGFDSTGAALLAYSHTTTASSRYNCGSRHQLSVANGATVTDAYMRYYVFNTVRDDANVDIDCEDVDNAADYTTTADVTSRTLTGNPATWAQDGLADPGSGGAGYKQSTSFVTAAQAVINRAGWASGNYMNVVASGRTDATKECRTRSFEGNSAEAPELTVTVAAGGTTVSATDAVTVSESTALDVPLPSSATDPVTVAEVTSLSLPIDAPVTDAVTLSDSASVSIEAIAAATIAVTDAVTVGESVALDIPLDISLTDAVSVAESASLDLLIALSVADAVSIGESNSVSVTGVSDISVSITDGVVVAEAVVMALPIAAATTDGITVGESTALALPLPVSATDGITIAESTGASMLLPVSVSDSISVAESTIFLLPLPVSATESVTIGQNIAINGATTLDYTISVTDAVVVAEIILSSWVFDVPAERIYTVLAENRIHNVLAENRVMIVEGESRIFVVRS